MGACRNRIPSRVGPLGDTPDAERRTDRAGFAWALSHMGDFVALEQPVIFVYPHAAGWGWRFVGGTVAVTAPRSLPSREAAHRDADRFRQEIARAVVVEVRQDQVDDPELARFLGPVG